MNAARGNDLRQLDLSAVKNTFRVTSNAIVERLRKVGPQSSVQLARWFRGTPEGWLNAVLADLVTGAAVAAVRNGLSRKRAGTVYELPFESLRPAPFSPFFFKIMDVNGLVWNEPNRAFVRINADATLFPSFMAAARNVEKRQHYGTKDEPCAVVIVPCDNGGNTLSE